MKILYICSDSGIPVLGRKGAAVHVRQLISAFRRAGHNVLLAVQTLQKSPWEDPAEIDCTVIQVKSAPGITAAVLALKEFNELLGSRNSLPGELRRILYNGELVAEINRRLENDPPDFIYERGSLYGTAGVSLGELIGVPVILELNAPLALEQSTYRSNGFGELAAQAEQWTLSRANAVAVVSADLGEHVRSLGVPPERIHVLPNGVDKTLFHPGPRDPESRARLGLDGGPVLGFVGGLRPWHGVEALPELFSRLLPRNPGLRLVIAGDGPLRGQLMEQLRQRGLTSLTTITGLVPHHEVPGLIRQFDIALAPYGEQSHAFYFSPLKLFEYMGCGVAVVAPKLGQIPSVIEDGKTGLLYPAGSLDALAEQCQKLLSDETLRRSIGLAAANRVHAEFTWDRNAAKIVQLAETIKAGFKESIAG